jgi:type I restriction enzyme S subunit
MNKDWIEVELEKVITIERGGSPRPIKEFITNDVNGINWIKIGDTTVNSKYILTTAEKIKPSGLKKTRQVKEGDLLLSNSMSFGRPYILKISGAIHDGWLVLSNRTEVKLCIDYFYYALSSPQIFSQFNKLATGSTVRNLNTALVSKVIFPLAPLPEQRAIVAKIEQLFSELDNGIANLKTAQQKLTLYKQAVLKKAFEGGFTEGEPRKLSTVCKKIQIGPFGSQLHREDYITDGIPLINPMHIQEGKVKPNNTYTISEEKKESLPNYIMHVGDVIMGRRGEMGRCALITDKENGWFCGTGSLYLRPDSEKVNSTYLNLYLGSQVIKRLLSEQAAGTTMMNLNKKIIQNLPFPSHTLSEQNQIVQEIESRLSVCDKVQETISQNLAKSEALRQSILKKAFSGKLLTETELTACRNAPDYAPASELLKKL